MRFRDINRDSLPVTFRMPVPGKEIGELIDIYYTEDDVNYIYLDKVNVRSINGEPYVIFQADHFTVFVTTPTNGTNISADKAVNSTSGSGYTTLSNIVIKSQASNDFPKNQTNRTIILTAPINRRFNAGVGTATATGTAITINSIAVTTSTITINYTRPNTNSSTAGVVISGIQVQALT